MIETGPFPDLAAFRRELVAWLETEAVGLRPAHVGHTTPADHIEQFRRVKAALWSGGWGRYGWPERVGGLGGSAMMRAVVGEEVASRDIADAGLWSMTEVLGPTVLAFASAELAAQVLPPKLRGEAIWCQGFSEPSTGSDLASLACRATPVDGGWLINGQKVWTSFADLAQHCVLLARTGEPGSAHRGITAFFIDIPSPGITYRPIEIQNGALEFCEVFYDDVFVPDERMLGTVGQGWQVAMDILPYERSTSFWHRGAMLHHRLDQLVGLVAPSSPDSSPGSSPGDVGDSPADSVELLDASTARSLGEAYQMLLAFRTRSMVTQRRLAAGETLGAETSVDKILVASSEQLLYDTARDLLPGLIEFGDDDLGRLWRYEYLYSRAATIYGGTAEVQRNIVARRLLDLGAE